MKAKITAKSELRLSDLTREYQFDILTDEGEIVLASQITREQPSQAKARIEQIVGEYQAVFEDANDVEIDEEI
jgi:hypothetical protein